MHCCCKTLPVVGIFFALFLNSCSILFPEHDTISAVRNDCGEPSHFYSADPETAKHLPYANALIGNFRVQTSYNKHDSLTLRCLQFASLFDITTATTIAAQNREVLLDPAVKSCFVENFEVTRDKRWLELFLVSDSSQFSTYSEILEGAPSRLIHFRKPEFHVPMETYKDRQIVDLKIDGVTYRAIFDYGAETTVVRKDMWNGRITRKDASTVVFSDGSTSSSDLTIADSIQIGDLVATQWPLTLTDGVGFTLYSFFLNPFEIDAVIGLDILRHLDVTFDYQAETILVASPTARDVVPNLYYLGSLRLVSTLAHGGQSILQFDNGSCCSGLHDLGNLKRTFNQPSSLYAACVDGYTVKIKSDMDKDWPHEDEDGVLGIDILNRTRYRVDMANMRLDILHVYEDE